MEFQIIDLNILIFLNKKFVKKYLKMSEKQSINSNDYKITESEMVSTD